MMVLMLFQLSPVTPPLPPPPSTLVLLVLFRNSTQVIGLSVSWPGWAWRSIPELRYSSVEAALLPTPDPHPRCLCIWQESAFSRGSSPRHTPPVGDETSPRLLGTPICVLTLGWGWGQSMRSTTRVASMGLGDSSVGDCACCCTPLPLHPSYAVN